MLHFFSKKRFLSSIVLMLLAIIYFNFFDKTPEQSSVTSEILTSTPSHGVVSTSTERGEYYTVVRVIDGDTIELEGGQKVRYIGMNTPEIHHPTKPVQCFGKEAAKRNEELVLNKKVHLVKDVSETDRYKRLLRYVYLEDGTFVNFELVKEGYAYVDTVPPDVKFSQEFKKTMEQARTEKKGLWATCK